MRPTEKKPRPDGYRVCERWGGKNRPPNAGFVLDEMDICNIINYVMKNL